MNKKIKIDGISFYASVQKPNKISEKFELSLIVTDKIAKDLEKIGLNSAKKKDGSDVAYEGFEGKVFKFKRKEALGSPKVVDSTGKPVDLLIGNGSKIRVYANLYGYEFMGKKGIAAGLNAVQIIDLVSFDDDGFDTIDGGFVVEESVVSVAKDATVSEDGIEDDNLDDFFNDK